MPIASLRITHFRNIAAAEFNPSQVGLNIIAGNNGSGKTSLLEAIHYLALGRSFRTSTPSRLIQQHTEKFSLFSQILNGETVLGVGVERTLQGATRTRIAEKEVGSIAELAQLLPIRVINSHSHHLFESGPQYRRQFLDWGLFYYSEKFLYFWRQYERVLKQRNSVLRDNRPRRELDAWTQELTKLGLEIHQLRLAYLAELAPLIDEMAQALFQMPNIKLNYQPGWREGESLADMFAQAVADEYRLGYTMYGPHRADFDVSIQGKSVKHFLSRGQQKLLICAMILAQGRLLTNQANHRVTYLVDDLPSELDAKGKQNLISLLSLQPVQSFITAIDSLDLGDLTKYQIPMRVFHVEHGKIQHNSEVVV